MSEPEITASKTTAYIVASREAVEAAGDAGLLAALGQALTNAMDPNYVPPPPPPDPGPNPTYLALIEAAHSNPVLAELVELHQPHAEVYPKADGMAPYIHWHCEGEPPSGYEWDWPDWPCETVAVIAQHLGVDLEAK